MRNKKWIIGLFLVSTLVLSSINVEAQDLRERTYYYEILEPRHEPKPEIKGFATERVKEKLDRGLTGHPICRRERYLPQLETIGTRWN